MKKKIIGTLMIATIAFTMLMGCGNTNSQNAQNGSEQGTDAQNGEKLKVSLLVTGSFGDKAFNDSAQAGMKRVEAELADKAEVKMIEMGNDKTKFEGSLLDASDSDADIIIVGSWDMKENLERVAPQYPDKRYIIFDTDVDYSLGGLENVYSMSYKQNEAAFLAGVLAAGVTTSDMEFANEEAIIGFVGAKDTAAVINDSAVGYIEGAKFMNPDIKVLVSYTGSYTDSATAKEIALTQYSSGADCVFVAAGPASVGVIEAGSESQKYVIGVDSDQALAYEGKKEADYIISSAIKDVGTSLYDSINKDIEGTLPYGTYEQLGLAENAVGLAENDIYTSKVPEDIRNNVENVKQSILNGDVTVSTAYGMEESKLKEIINSAQ